VENSKIVSVSDILFENDFEIHFKLKIKSNLGYFKIKEGLPYLCLDLIYDLMGKITKTLLYVSKHAEFYVQIS
jgi:hypothetical protein